MKTAYRFDNTKNRWGREQHLHTFEGKPLIGATTLIGRIMPPPLTWWASGMACKFMGWYDKKETRSNYLPDEEGMPILKEKLEKIKEMNPEEYQKFLTKAYKAHNEYKKEKGEYGDKVHKGAEQLAKGLSVKDTLKELKAQNWKDDDWKDVESALEQIKEWQEDKEVPQPECHVFSEKLWIGGIIDAPYSKGDKWFLGDYKTSKGIYPSQFIQMGIYDALQAKNGFVDTNGKVIGKPKEVDGYTVINIPKGGKLKELTYCATQEMREFAENLAELYKRKQKLEKFIK